MSTPANTKLQQTIRDITAKIRRFRDRGLGEQNTKASLVEPVLEALGWDSAIRMKCIASTNR